MKIGIVSNQDFSKATLIGLSGCKDNHVTLIGLNSAVADKFGCSHSLSLHEQANKLGVDTYFASTPRLDHPEDKKFFEVKNFDIVFVLGWNFIISSFVIGLPKYGFIGSHSSPYMLPFGKGRSPINWSLLLGFKSITFNLFRITSGIDEGAIVLQKEMPLESHDDMQSMLLKLAVQQGIMTSRLISIIREQGSLPEFHTSMKLPELNFPKRTHEDGRISLELGCEKIHRLVRAVSKPFGGAFCELNETRLLVNRLDFVLSSEKLGALGEIVYIASDCSFIAQGADGFLIFIDYETDCEVGVGHILE